MRLVARLYMNILIVMPPICIQRAKDLLCTILLDIFFLIILRAGYLHI